MANIKKVITPTEVTITNTEVANKKKRTTKKSATLRSKTDVLDEIVNTPVEVSATTEAIAEIVGPAKKRETGVLRRINDNGDINLSKITAKEKAELIAIGKKLNVHDKMSVSSYGSELSAQLDKSTKELMRLGRNANLSEEMKDTMQSINSKLMEIDLDDIKKPNWFVKAIRQVPVLNKMFFSVKKFLNKWDDLEQEVNSMQEKLQAARAIAIRDNTELEKRFQDTIQYIQVLEKLIVAAKIKSEEYEAAIAEMEANPDNYTAIAIHDAKNFKHELDKKVSSMLTWHLSFNQSLFRIREIQDANIAHSNAISESVDNMMPQLRDQLHQAIVLYNLEQGLKAHEVMINGFNEILKHNADATHDLKVRVTEQTEKTTIDLETLKHNQQKIIDTNRDVLKIINEAAQRRLENEREMAKMETELETMMSGSVTDSAKLIENKYES